MRPGPDDWPEVLTLQEMADYLKISYITGHRLLKAGALPGRQVGGQWRVLRRQLEALLGVERPRPSPSPCAEQALHALWQEVWEEAGEAEEARP